MIFLEWGKDFSVITHEESGFVRDTGTFSKYFTVLNPLGTGIVKYLH